MTEENAFQPDQPGPPAFEQSLRPATLSDFTGQQKVKERLEVMVESARMRDEAMDHVMLSGPPGLGKTTLAHILANAMGVEARITSGPALEKPGDLAGILTNLQEKDVLFIDEIHRLNKTIEEYLYPAMEDYRIDIIIDQGPSARSICLNLPRFTLVGATTRPGMVSAPLRSRFGIMNRLEYYDVETLEKIVTRSAGLLDVKLEKEAVYEISRRSRGTPRISNNLLRWLRDFALVRKVDVVDRATADAALAMLEIDEDGLDEVDTRLLETLVHRFSGGPVGLTSLAMAIGEDAGTVEDVHEPFLVLKGYVQRTQQGRVALPLTYQKLGVEMGKRQGDLL